MANAFFLMLHCYVSLPEGNQLFLYLGVVGRKLGSGSLCVCADLYKYSQYDPLRSENSLQIQINFEDVSTCWNLQPPHRLHTQMFPHQQRPGKKRDSKYALSPWGNIPTRSWQMNSQSNSATAAKHQDRDHQHTKKQQCLSLKRFDYITQTKKTNRFLCSRCKGWFVSKSKSCSSRGIASQFSS